MQKSKNGLGFQVQLHTENILDKSLIMIYLSLVIYVTLLKLTKNGLYPS